MRTSDEDHRDVLYYKPAGKTRYSKKHDITPFKQGIFDTACSLYAAINLIGLNLKLQGQDLDYEDGQAIYDAILEDLDGGKWLARLVDGRGIRKSRWRKIVESACTNASEIMDAQFTAEWHKDVKDEAGLLGLLRQDQPVSLMTKVDDGLRHYTVLTGFDKDVFRLFDSSVYKRLPRKSDQLFIAKGTVVTINVS